MENGPWVPALLLANSPRHSGVGRLKHPLADGGGAAAGERSGGLGPPDSPLLPSPSSLSRGWAEELSCGIRLRVASYCN